jgi:ketosteroid isomerase-like protein
MRSQHIWALLFVAGLGILHAVSPARATATLAADDQGFRTFLQDFEHATTRFINGDPGPWQALVSQRADVTLMGGWGIVARGWQDTSARYDWAARRFVESGAVLQVEYVSTVVSGDLACTVAIERSTPRLADAPAAAPMTLRVTHAFRREDGRWKLLHRHADPLIDTMAPASVLKR